MDKYWHIPKIWEGDCYIIGGGTSLADFPFTKLHNKRVIGCNNAFELGPYVCDLVCFGDKGWYHIYKDADNASGITFRDYPGMLVTNAENFYTDKQVKVCRRVTRRIETRDDTLGWFANTGAMAIELAAKMGATRIILLGFDMKLNDKQDKANWYNNIKDKPNPDIYKNKFMKCFGGFKQIFNIRFPGVEVINANPDSALETYKKQPWEELL